MNWRDRISVAASALLGRDELDIEAPTIQKAEPSSGQADLPGPPAYDPEALVWDPYSLV